MLGSFSSLASCKSRQLRSPRLVHVLAGGYWTHWLSLHLLLLGGVSQLVLGAGHFFTCAFLATDPPPRRLIVAQLACWNGGTVLVAVGVPTRHAGLAQAGGGLIATGLVLFAGRPAPHGAALASAGTLGASLYLASAGCLSLSALIGVLIARGTIWQYGDLLGAHLALNLAGWLGTAILGTLHTFFPSLTQTQHLRAEALRAVAEQLATVQPALGESEAAYRVLQRSAHLALRRHPRPDSNDSALEDATAVATTWWCPECGGIDAPQPCLGICIWRPIDWVDKDVYEQEREQALAEDQAERRLRRLLRRMVSVTPRSGQWERGWRAAGRGAAGAPERKQADGSGRMTVALARPAPSAQPIPAVRSPPTPFGADALYTPEARGRS